MASSSIDLLYRGQSGNAELHPKKLLCSRRTAKVFFSIILLTAAITWTRFFLKSKVQEVELSRMKRMIATHGAACGDIKHIGGVMRGEVLEVGFWNICVDPEFGLQPSSCLAYSFGTTDQWSFEKDLATSLRCQVIRFDPAHLQKNTDNVEELLISHSFSLLGMSSNNRSGRENLQTRTFHSILSAFGHQKVSIVDLDNLLNKATRNDKVVEFPWIWKKIDILKLNLSESEEWDVLSQLLKEGTLTRQVKQLLFTIHLDSTLTDELIRWQTAIDWLTLQGFRLFNRNKGQFCDNCYELSWVNEYI